MEESASGKRCGYDSVNPPFVVCFRAFCLYHYLQGFFIGSQQGLHGGRGSGFCVFHGLAFQMCIPLATMVVAVFTLLPYWHGLLLL